MNDYPKGTLEKKNLQLPTTQFWMVALLELLTTVPLLLIIAELSPFVLILNRFYPNEIEFSTSLKAL